jgi:peptide/nickel transport system ATP-binding protein
VLRAHRDWTQQRCRQEAKLLLEEMDLEDIDRVYSSYPHQLSGGQRQRIVIAQALACRPALVIADEPTSSLDPSTASAIVELLGKLTRRFNTAFLIISHDATVLARLADRIMVMYAGRIVEQGPSQKVLQEPLHPYTRALLDCALPDSAASNRRFDGYPVPTIAGSAADHPQALPHCGFAGRCPDHIPVCSMRVPTAFEVADAHTVSCFRFGGS